MTKFILEKNHLEVRTPNVWSMVLPKSNDLILEFSGQMNYIFKKLCNKNICSIVKPQFKFQVQSHQKLNPNKEGPNLD